VDDLIQEPSQELKSVYTLADIDRFTIAQIEQGKAKFLSELNSYSEHRASESLQDLLSLMQTILEKYFTKETIEKKKIDGFDFYTIKRKIKGNVKISTVRRACELSFTIYNQFIKQIGVEIPTTTVNVKKK
jgi:predicted house-cleaning noncanonical NTP pyrophosphatase (MazG superfamily)